MPGPPGSLSPAAFVGDRGGEGEYTHRPAVFIIRRHARVCAHTIQVPDVVRGMHTEVCVCV